MKATTWFDNSIDKYAAEITDDSGKQIYRATGSTAAVAKAYLRAKIEGDIRRGEKASKALDCSFDPLIEEDEIKECPMCYDKMKFCVGTRAEMTGVPSDDNTTVIEWQECKCGYYE